MKTFFWFLYFIWTLFATLPSLKKVKKLDRENKIEERNKITQQTAMAWAASLVRKSGSSIKVYGQENVPKDSNVLIVSNHQSNFDIPVLISSIDKLVGFIAKKELGKIPIMNSWMMYLRCVLINRGNPRDALKAINQGAEYLKEGYSQVIFPEGTRSASGIVGEFKPGSLKLAKKSGVTILPVAIKGAHKIMEKGSLAIHPAEVEVHILPPIYKEEYIDQKDTSELAARLQRMIAEKVNG